MILNGFIRALRVVYRYMRTVLGVRLALPATALTALSILLFPIFLFAIGPRRIARGTRDGLRSFERRTRATATGIAKTAGVASRRTASGIGWIVYLLIRLVQTIVAAPFWILGTLIAAVIVFTLPGFAAVGWLLLMVSGTLALIALGALVAIVGRRNGFVLWLGGTIAVFGILAFFWGLYETDWKALGQTSLFLVLLAMFTLWALAGWIKGKRNFSTGVLGVVALAAGGYLLWLFLSSASWMVAPGFAEGASKHLTNVRAQLWNKSERSDIVEKAENDVDASVNDEIRRLQETIERMRRRGDPSEAIAAVYSKLQEKLAQAEANKKPLPPAPTAPIQPLVQPAVPAPSAVPRLERAELVNNGNIPLNYSWIYLPTGVEKFTDTLKPGGWKWWGDIRPGVDVYIFRDAENREIARVERGGRYETRIFY